ncbi:hypothetical protein [Desulfosporosinus sp. OT]|uniref:hypothetical protein n=1 Tax=Desulfosporosinus sp. OT TaxID=913865 RepID=UPI000223A2CC|nr:hypothetical protein [Desulfosporosinus sp. OT]EGW39244.1 M domain protein [Desulfosporosinus sp. OT]
MEKEIKEMLGLILNKLDRLESEMNGLKSEMNGLKSEMNGLKSEMNGLKSETNGLKSETNGLKSRQDEIFMVVKAIEHNSEVRGAEIDNFKYKVHHVEGTLNAIGDVITTRKAI